VCCQQIVLRGLDRVWEGKGVRELCVESREGKRVGREESGGIVC